MAKQGHVVLAIDAPGHGKSCIIGSKDWREAARRLKPVKLNLFYQVYVAVVRSIEVLKHIKIVDPERIGIVGVSMGGMAAIVAGSLHPAVKAVIPIVASGCIPCMIASGGLFHPKPFPHTR